MTVVPLSSLGRSDAARFGTKAAHLGELERAGFLVPGGVAVPAAEDPADAARQALTALGSGPFAVRSSALAEDLPGASFAGQYESYLGVDGADDVAEAIRKCRVSGSAARVATYREQRGEAGPTEVVVVVQRLVAARAAGVAFTADPITGRRDVVRVSAVRGLGEQLVSGEVRADEWLVEGGTPRAVRCEHDALGAREVRELAELARKVEERFGAPQDVEWAWDGERVHLLQARPITALPEAVSWTAPPRGWSRSFRLGEWLGAPLTPLAASWLVRRLDDRLCERYFEVGGAPRPERMSTLVNGWYYTTLDFVPTRPLVVLGMLARFALRLVRDWRTTVMMVPPLAHLGVERQVDRWRNRISPAYRQAVVEAREQVETSPIEQLPTLIDGLLDHAGDTFTWITFVGGYAWKSELPLARFYREHLVARVGGSHQDLLVGFGAPELPPHAVESLDWFHPTLGERGMTADPDAAARKARLAARASEAMARCKAALDPARAEELERLVAVTRRFAALREEQAAELTLAWPVLRRALARIGEALVARGALADADDVYFLEESELRATLGGAPCPHTAPRRALHVRQARLVPPLVIGEMPAMLKSVFDQVELLRSEPQGNVLVRGLPASPGRVTARVRIVRGPEDFDRLAPGDVLVAPVTTPVWTPLFARAAAVVTDNGSPIAHASLVAREYGIPAVVGTGNGTERLEDGQIVTVDGSAGVVVS